MSLKHTEEPLYVILPYFNFVGFKRRKDLFLEFVDRYRDEPHIKIVVVEALGPTPLGRLPGIKHVTLKSKSTVWLKENLINLGVESLPRGWKYVAWIDADLEFLNQNWVRDTIHELQTADVVQMWRSAVNLGPYGETIKTDKSFAYMFVGSGTKWNPTDKYGFWHPGYAWACTRSAYEQMGGLVEWAILGSGDRHMAMAFAGLALESAPEPSMKTIKAFCVSMNRGSRTLRFRGSMGRSYTIGTARSRTGGTRNAGTYLQRMRMTPPWTLSLHIGARFNSRKRARGSNSF
jgi:hypothetical protein